jgi:hypothetical protein
MTYDHVYKKAPLNVDGTAENADWIKHVRDAKRYGASHQLLIDRIVQVAAEGGANHHPMRLKDLYDAYRQAFPAASTGQTEEAFGATLNEFCINVKSRFLTPSEKHKSTNWHERPLFKRMARGYYMLLAKDEIARFRRCVKEGDPVITQDEYNVTDLRAASGKITFILSNEELTVDDIPTSDADWWTITAFAQTFDGYPYGDLYARERYDAMLIDWHAMYEEYGSVPTLLTHLRGCLFHEQRSWRQSDVGMPTGSDYLKSMAHAHALLQAIREKVHTGHIW